jgi:hypothetical protein
VTSTLLVGSFRRRLSVKRAPLFVNRAKGVFVNLRAHRLSNHLVRSSSVLLLLPCRLSVLISGLHCLLLLLGNLLLRKPFDLPSLHLRSFVRLPPCQLLLHSLLPWCFRHLSHLIFPLLRLFFRHVWWSILLKIRFYFSSTLSSLLLTRGTWGTLVIVFGRFVSFVGWRRGTQGCEDVERSGIRPSTGRGLVSYGSCPIVVFVGFVFFFLV